MEGIINKIETFVEGKIKDFDAHPLKVGIQLIIAFMIVKWLWKQVKN